VRRLLFLLGQKDPEKLDGYRSWEVSEASGVGK
jgi:hypothetical protein